jgi:hypothetical protein
VGGQSNLLQIVSALGPTSGFPRRLDRGEQEGNQDGNNGNDDQQFNQRKTLRPAKHH